MAKFGVPMLILDGGEHTSVDLDRVHACYECRDFSLWVA